MKGNVIVRIAIGMEREPQIVDEVIYFRSGMTPDFYVRWSWFFEYLAALVKVRHPKRRMYYSFGPAEFALGQEWHELRRAQLLRSRQIKLKKLERDGADIEDDIFGFGKEEQEKKIRKCLGEIASLEADTYPIPEFPEDKNTIKKWL